MKNLRLLMFMMCLLVPMLALSGCGGDTSDSSSNVVTGLNWTFENIAPDVYDDGMTCGLRVYVYCSGIAASDIDSFTIIAPDGYYWQIPASEAQFGTSGGKNYLGALLGYDENLRTIQLAGTWTAQVKLKNGKVSTYQRKLREPGMSSDATHKYVYAAEDWTPPLYNYWDYTPLLRRIPTGAFTVAYSSVNGGRISTTGFAAVRTAYLSTETKFYNMYCWLYDVNQNYMGMSVTQYSPLDHTSTGLVVNGEIGITASLVTTSMDLSRVKYMRVVCVDGAQFQPTSYSSFDSRSMSTLLSVQ